jgi:hypothetical protein
LLNSTVCIRLQNEFRFLLSFFLFSSFIYFRNLVYEFVFFFDVFSLFACLILVGLHEVFEVEKMDVDVAAHPPSDHLRALLAAFYDAKSPENCVALREETMRVYSFIETATTTPPPTIVSNNSNNNNNNNSNNANPAASNATDFALCVTKSQLERALGRKAIKRANILTGFRMIVRVYGEREEAWTVPRLMRWWGVEMDSSNELRSGGGGGGGGAVASTLNAPKSTTPHNVPHPVVTIPDDEPTGGLATTSLFPVNVVAVAPTIAPGQADVPKRAKGTSGKADSTVANSSLNSNANNSVNNTPPPHTNRIAMPVQSIAAPPVANDAKQSSVVLHPWIDFTGVIDDSMLATVTNMLAHLITENPGILEEALIARASVLIRPSALRDLLQMLELQDVVYAKRMVEPEPVGLFSNARETARLSPWRGEEAVDETRVKKIYFARPDLVLKLDGLLNHAVPKGLIYKIHANSLHANDNI